jgi:hypothetical protein
MQHVRVDKLLSAGPILTYKLGGNKDIDKRKVSFWLHPLLNKIDLKNHSQPRGIAR